MKGRTLLVSAILILSFTGMLAIFWYQENQYLFPTPVPKNYKAVYPGEVVEVSAFIDKTFSKPVLLHFFNPDCPCSRFNMEHFQRIVARYKGKMDFYAVLHSADNNEAKSRFQDKYGLDIPVIRDTNNKLAEACGVYATPQAAILDQKGQLYYRGNYNKSRYCTDANSNFAQMAIDSLLAAKPSPVFIELATRAYGCELPDNLTRINNN
jgi:hypothetical protein